MATAPRTALVAAGPVSVSWVAKLPGLRSHLQFVKAGSLRVASRIANSIRAGEAVEHYEDLRLADLVLVYVPGGDLGATVDEMSKAAMRWKDRAIVLCGKTLDPHQLLPLKQAGAAVGSLDPMEGFDEKRFLFEGDRNALLRLRRLVEMEGTAKVVELERQGRAAYEAGLTFAESMTFQMVAAAVESFRTAGLRDKQAEIAVEAAVLRALRSYLTAGRRGWSGPLANGDHEELSRQYKALASTRPDIAELFLKFAIEYLAERGPELGKPTLLAKAASAGPGPGTPSD
ncbi:MAG: DUF2520 domain-containing protein [Bryobacter sp.]|nr:DUF2520 domain-containing protein [Bryobacter sp.]